MRECKPYWAWVLLLAFGSSLTGSVSAQKSDVLGEVQLEGKTKVEKTSGVWVDGQYVGYLKELKGSKKLLLLPGDHTISVRQNGYQDFNQKVTVQMPPDAELATVKINVNPTRAAVFLDGRFVGHAGELGGIGKALQVVAGTHQIRISLPGYKTFQTDINPLPKQKVEVKTDLVKSAVPETEPFLKRDN